jgi:hypothetical protein
MLRGSFETSSRRTCDFSCLSLSSCIIATISSRHLQDRTGEGGEEAESVEILQEERHNSLCARSPLHVLNHLLAESLSLRLAALDIAEAIDQRLTVGLPLLSQLHQSLGAVGTNRLQFRCGDQRADGEGGGYRYCRQQRAASPKSFS